MKNNTRCTHKAPQKPNKTQFQTTKAKINEIKKKMNNNNVAKKDEEKESSLLINIETLRCNIHSQHIYKVVSVGQWNTIFMLNTIFTV